MGSDSPHRIPLSIEGRSDAVLQGRCHTSQLNLRGVQNTHVIHVHTIDVQAIRASYTCEVCAVRTIGADGQECLYLLGDGTEEQERLRSALRRTWKGVLAIDLSGERLVRERGAVDPPARGGWQVVCGTSTTGNVHRMTADCRRVALK